MAEFVNPEAGNSESGTDSKSELDILEEGSEEETTEEITETGDESESEETSEETESEEAEPESESEEEGSEEEETTTDDEVIEESEELETSRPSWNLIKEKFPELAKDKDFKNLYFRDKVLLDLFPTVDNAKIAAQKAEAMDILEADFNNGNVANVLKDLDQGSIEKLTDRILPALWEHNPKLFQRATQPLIIDLLNNVLENAERMNDNNLKLSVRNISKFLTGNADVPKRINPNFKDPEVEKERKALQDERLNIFRQQERNFLVATDNSIAKEVEKLVKIGLDPKKELTEFATQFVVEKTLNDIKKILTNDEGLRNKIFNIHKLAARAGFSNEYKSRIISASLERAKKIIPGIRNKYKLAATSKKPASVPNNGKLRVNVKPGEIKTTNSGRVTSVKQIDTKRTSAEDFLNDKIVPRK